MPLSIRNPRAEELARRAARATGKSMTDVIVEALEEKLARIETNHGNEMTLARIMEISERCASLPTVDDRDEGEILGYGDTGA